MERSRHYASRVMMLLEPKAIVFGFRVMVEPRTRSRDLVEAVVRGRQVIIVTAGFGHSTFYLYHSQDELLARLQCGECPDTTATLGRTALHAAAANANLAAVAALVEHGADVRIADNNGYTALHMACTR